MKQERQPIPEERIVQRVEYRARTEKNPLARMVLQDTTEVFKMIFSHKNNIPDKG